MTLPCRSFERRRGSRPSSGGFRRARLFFLRRRGTIAARKQGGTDMEKQPQLHTIAPVYDENSRILILGSFPSVKSREAAVFLRPSAKPLLACARRCARRGRAPQTAAEKEVPAPAPWRRAVGRHRLLRHCRLVRREHHECGAKRPLAHSGRRAGPPHLLQRRHGLPLLPPVRRGRMGERRRLCPPPVPPTRARPCRRSRSAGARRSRRGFDGSEPVKNVTLTC